MQVTALNLRRAWVGLGCNWVDAVSADGGVDTWLTGGAPCVHNQDVGTVSARNGQCEESPFKRSQWAIQSAHELAKDTEARRHSDAGQREMRPATPRRGLGRRSNFGPK